ncbi:hypothetical protein ANO11243_016840 [Dothideomycetidae sp. 11243]|nr:hypothetical protein ANO11243_016840 [fungal sp. No.11243]
MRGPPSARYLDSLIDFDLARTMPNSVWRSERLVYRAIEAEDGAVLDTLYSPDDWEQMEISVLTPRESWKTNGLIEKFSNATLGTVICLPTITEQDEQHLEPIGLLNLFAIADSQRQHRSTALGISIGRQYQRRGYGTEAIKWAVEWGFRHANLHRIWLEAFQWNIGAVRAYEHAGFKLEVQARSDLWYKGQFRDSVVMSILEDEWRASQRINAQ